MILERRLKASFRLSRGGLDHRHDDGLDQLGQLRPGIDQGGRVGVIPVPGTDPATRWRNRRPTGGGRSSRRQPGRWSSSTSIYPLTTPAPSGGTGRVKVRRAHRNGQSPGHDSRLRTSVYGVPRGGERGSGSNSVAILSRRADHYPHPFRYIPYRLRPPDPGTGRVAGRTSYLLAETGFERSLSERTR